MKIKYFTDDGTEFDSEAEALEWEGILAKGDVVREYVNKRFPEYTAKHATRLVNIILGWEKSRNEFLGA